MHLGAGAVAVVTGASSGIGLALSDALARIGCSLVLADIEEESLAVAREQVGAHGTDTLAVRTDVSKREQVEALAAATIDRFGKVHVLCNNAGVSGRGDPWTGPLESWEWTMGVNFWGVVYGVRAFLPHLVLSGGGHIVNTASIAGLLPGFGGAYDASKHAVVALTEDLFNTLRAAQIPVGVSCLCPGWVRTRILDADRNWPSELGTPPSADIAESVIRRHVQRAVDEGTDPQIVADHVVEAIRSGGFWIFPDPEFVVLAVERFRRIGEHQDPTVPEEFPGLPPRSQLMAEALAAMAAAAQSE